MSNLVNSYLNNFLQIYPALDSGKVFPTLKDILLFMGPVSQVSKSSISWRIAYNEDIFAERNTFTRDVGFYQHNSPR